MSKDANVVVDGRKLYNDGQCLSTKYFSELLIDLGEVLSIHHITTYINIPSGLGSLGIYIPIFLYRSFFLLLLLFLHVTLSTVSAADRKISTFLKDDAGMKR